MPRSLKGRIQASKIGLYCDFLKINAANFSGAVVDVEVGGDFRLLGLTLRRGSRRSNVGIPFIKDHPSAERAEVLFHIVAATQQALLFTRPNRRCGWCGEV